MRSIEVSPQGELHKRIVDGVRERVKASKAARSTRDVKWRELEELFVAYMPEKEDDLIRKLNRKNAGTPEYTTIQLPYSYAIAMAAHSYFATVFLSRIPVFQFAGFHGEGEDQVLAMEALHNWQVYKSKMLGVLYIWLQDLTKYGEAWVMNYWTEEFRTVSNIVERPKMFLGMLEEEGKTEKVRETKRIRGYQGNKLANVHPAKVLTDPRYSRSNFQDGEFVAVFGKVSRNDLLKGEDQGRYINTDHRRFKRAGTANAHAGYELQEESASDKLEVPRADAFGTAMAKEASDVYEIYEVIIEIVPSDWKLGKSNMPEKWVFTVLADWSVVIEARPLGYIHDRFPLAQLETEMDAYFHHSRSLLEVYEPVQNTLDWLVNSHFYNVRQVLNNQFILDPSRVNIRDFERNDPGLAVRMSPAGYGTDPRTAVHQLPVADVTQGHLRDMDMMYNFGERLGINDSIMGMTHPSSRRSAQEVRGSQSFGMSRLKTITEFMSATGWDELASMMVQNSQQFFDSEMKLRIAGSTADLAGEAFTNVTPEQIAGEYSFEPVDGSIPVDRYAQASMWREILTQMKEVPQVYMQYDLGKIFGYVAQLGGIKNLNRFKVQVQDNDRMQAQMQAGNAVPMATPGNDLEPGQTTGMGPTA